MKSVALLNLKIDSSAAQTRPTCRVSGGIPGILLLPTAGHIWILVSNAYLNITDEGRNKVLQDKSIYLDQTNISHLDGTLFRALQKLFCKAFIPFIGVRSNRLLQLINKDLMA